MSSITKPKRALLAYCALADRIHESNTGMFGALAPFFAPVTAQLVFLPVFPSAGAGSCLAATDAADPDSPVPGGFPFSVPAHSLFLRRTTPRPSLQ